MSLSYALITDTYLCAGLSVSYARRLDSKEIIPYLKVVGYIEGRDILTANKIRLDITKDNAIVSLL